MCGDDFILPEANYDSLEKILNANDFGVYAFAQF